MGPDRIADVDLSDTDSLSSFNHGCESNQDSGADCSADCALLVDFATDGSSSIGAGEDHSSEQESVLDDDEGGCVAGVFVTSDGRYQDVGKALRERYDIGILVKSWNPKPAMFLPPNREVTDWVLNSVRLRRTVDKLVAAGQGNSSELLLKAKGILEETGHSYRLLSVKLLAFATSKLVTRLFSSIWINPDGFEKLQNVLARDVPVLFLPTHRSYADFILVSFLCFISGVPLPVIAAGMDFKSMAVVNTMLQNGGAFYIRRSFGKDALYWTIISEYIRYHLVNVHGPLKFFLEGTRSRIGKSLPPKTGLLSLALQPYLKGELADLQICTVSISYERTLEEELYAYEILGIPKPKESTSGFLNAVDKVMCQSYGQVYFNVTEPVSVRNYVSRSPPKWNLPLSLEKLDDGEKADIQKLASLMVAKQQKEAITPVFAVLASILASSEACDPLELEQRFLGYDSLLADFGTRCLVQGDLSKVIKECLDVHNAKITVDEAGKYSFRSPAEDQDLQTKSAQSLVVQNYTNQLLSPLICVAVFATTKSRSGLVSDEDIIEESSLLAQYLCDEFVMIRPLTVADIDKLRTAPRHILRCLRFLLEPYLEIFYLILCILETGLTTAKEITARYKTIAAEVLENGASSHLHILAVDKIPRHLNNLVTNGNLRLIKSESQISYEVVDVSSLIARMDTYISPALKQQVESQCSNSSHHLHSRL